MFVCPSLAEMSGTGHKNELLCKCKSATKSNIYTDKFYKSTWREFGENSQKPHNKPSKGA